MAYGLVDGFLEEQNAAAVRRRWLMPFAQEIVAAIKRPKLCKVLTSGIREWVRRQDDAIKAAFVAWQKWHLSGEAEKALIAAEERAAAVKWRDGHDLARVYFECVARRIATEYTKPQIDELLPLSDRQYTSMERQVILAAVHDYFADVTGWDWIGPGDSQRYTTFVHAGVPKIAEDYLPLLKAWLSGFNGQSTPNKSQPTNKKGDRMAGVAKRLYDELSKRIKSEQKRIQKDEREGPKRLTWKELAKCVDEKQPYVSKCVKKYPDLCKLFDAFKSRQRLMDLKL